MKPKGFKLSLFVGSRQLLGSPREQFTIVFLLTYSAAMQSEQRKHSKWFEYVNTIDCSVGVSIVE